MKSINDISFKLILISIFLIPLTISDHRLIINLGEFRNETYIYPLLLAIFLFSINTIFKGKIKIPITSPFFLIIIFFLIWCIFTFVFSFFSIYQSEFKGTIGIFRFIKQFFSLTLSVLIIPLTLYNIFIKYNSEILFKKIENIIIWSLIIVFIFAVLAIFSVLYNNKWAHDIILWINNGNPILYIKEDLYLKRISSISHEPPFLGMYLIFILPWILRGLIISVKKWKFAILFIMILILAIVSKSRAAQLFCLIEIIVFFIFLIIHKKKILLNLIKGVTLVIIFLPLIFLWKGDVILNTLEERIDAFRITKNIETNNSNKTRMGTIIAGLKIFYEHRIAGVGYGQQGYYLMDKYPKWAVEGNWEIERYLDEKEMNYPPGFNLYVRLLAETGLIGFLIFILLTYYLLYSCLIKYLLSRDINYLFFLTTFIGFMFNWMQIDTPRIYGFWVVFTLFLIYHKQDKHEKKRINYSNTSL